jgi:hemoglobin
MGQSAGRISTRPGSANAVPRSAARGCLARAPAPLRRLALLAAACAFLAGAAKADGSLFAELGGLPVITAVARTAGATFRSDPRIKDYFDNINPDWLRPRLIAFLCHVSGGPCVYPGRAMGPAHKGLHIDAAAFDAFMQDFQAAMVRAGIPAATQDRLLARLLPLGRDVVTR